MLSIIRNSGTVFRALTAQGETVEVEEALILPNLHRYDEIFNSKDRQSDSEVLANVMAQL